MKAQWHQIHTDDARATDAATWTCPSSMEIVTDGAVSAGPVGVAEVETSGAETPAKVTDKEMQDATQAVREERASGHALDAGNSQVQLERWTLRSPLSHQRSLWSMKSLVRIHLKFVSGISIS